MREGLKGSLILYIWISALNAAIFLLIGLLCLTSGLSRYFLSFSFAGYTLYLPCLGALIIGIPLSYSALYFVILYLSLSVKPRFIRFYNRAALVFIISYSLLSFLVSNSESDKSLKNTLMLLIKLLALSSSSY